MILKNIISFLVFIWVICGIVFLVDYYYFIYSQNMKLVKESKTFKSNSIEEQVLSKYELENQINEIVLWIPTLDDIIKSTDKKKKYLTTLSIEEQNIKHDLSTTLNLSTSEKVKLLKEKREKSQEEKDVLWKELFLKIPSVDISISTLPITTWNISDVQEIKDEDIYSTIDTLLEKGPVRFPWIDIIDNWVTTIYWHSSQTKNIKNYSFFRTLPFIIKDQLFYLSSNKRTYTYKVLESKEVNISDVMIIKEQYKSEFPDKKFIFLITCYPINTSEKRWIVIWEQTSSEYNKTE